MIPVSGRQLCAIADCRPSIARDDESPSECKEIAVVYCGCGCVSGSEDQLFVFGSGLLTVFLQ